MKSNKNINQKIETRIKNLLGFKKNLKNKDKRLRFLKRSNKTQINHICECVLPENLLNLKKSKQLKPKGLHYLRKKKEILPILTNKLSTLDHKKKIIAQHGGAIFSPILDTVLGVLTNFLPRDSLISKISKTALNKRQKIKKKKKA